MTSIYLEAKDYNASFSEDKRLKVVFATPAMLSEQKNIEGKQVSFFAALEYERNQVSTASGSYEGNAVYVFCVDDNDINTSKKNVAKNDQHRIALAVPKNPIPVYEAIIILNALESDWFKSQTQDFGPYERAEELRIRTEANKVLAEAKTSYFSNSKVYWSGYHGHEIPVSEIKRFDAANKLITEIYGANRNTFGHNEFNKIHINISGSVRGIFKEAGDILCDLSQPIRVNWSWPDNRGGTKYLRKCFVDHQALRILSLEGDVRYLETEKDLGKFRTALPAYSTMLEELAALDNKGQTNLLSFLKPYYEEYGQGEIAITLMLLLARRFYGDSLRFKHDPNNLTDIQITSTEDMLSLVQGQSLSAVVLFEPVSAEDQAYFAKVTQLFTNQPAPAGKIYTISDAYQAITNWWANLPIIARSLGFYPDEEKPIAEAFSQAKTKDPFRFIKHDLLELLGQMPNELLTHAKLLHIEVFLKAFKSTAEAIQENVEEQILVQIAEIFGISSHLDDDIKDAIKNWYNGLSNTQKDPMGTYHNNDSKPLVKYTAYANIRELLFTTLPEAYSLSKVATWMSDYGTTYTQRIRNGKLHIETNAPQLGILNVDFQNALSQHGDQVTYKGELILHVSTEDGKGVIYYTEDGSDPTVSQHRNRLASGDTLTIKGNRKVKLVVADEKGNYSAVKPIEAVDELHGSVIERSQQTTAFDEVITFVFPKSKEAAWVTVSSLIKEIIKANILSIDELRKLVLYAVDQVEHKK